KTSILEHLILILLLPWEHESPWLRPHRRIFECGVIMDPGRTYRNKIFDQVEVSERDAVWYKTRSSRCPGFGLGLTAAASQLLEGIVCRIDDESIPLPMPPRVAIPFADVGVEMRAA